LVQNFEDTGAMPVDELGTSFFPHDERWQGILTHWNFL